MRIQKKCELKISAYQNEEDSGSHGRIHTWGLGNFGERKKIWTISRFMRVILAQGPC